MDIPLALAALSVAVSLVSAGAVFARRKNHIVEGLRSELDLALEENKRLVAELAQTADDLHAARLKVTPEKLSEHARIGVAYAEQMGGTGEEKLRHALGASIIGDKGANGRQDWTDAQHRIAIEAEISRKK